MDGVLFVIGVVLRTEGKRVDDAFLHLLLPPCLLRIQRFLKFGQKFHIFVHGQPGWKTVPNDSSAPVHGVPNSRTREQMSS